MQNPKQEWINHDIKSDTLDIQTNRSELRVSNSKVPGSGLSVGVGSGHILLENKPLKRIICQF